jgi:hypothetical protein
MRTLRALLVGALLLAACGGEGSTSVYASVGYSPWGWGACCYPVGVYGPPVVVAPPVRPPSGGRPPSAGAPRPSQPIARPTSAAPRPAAPRGGGGGRRR